MSLATIHPQPTATAAAISQSNTTKVLARRWCGSEMCARGARVIVPLPAWSEFAQRGLETLVDMVLLQVVSPPIRKQRAGWGSEKELRLSPAHKRRTWAAVREVQFVAGTASQATR